MEKHAEILDSKREQVLAEWRKRVRTIERTESLDNPTLNDYIPSLLDAICVSLRQQRAVSPNMSAAEVHGLQRLWIGFDVVEVVAELREEDEPANRQHRCEHPRECNRQAEADRQPAEGELHAATG